MSRFMNVFMFLSLISSASALRFISEQPGGKGWKDVDTATAETRLQSIQDAHTRSPAMCTIYKGTYKALQPCTAAHYMKEYYDADLPDFNAEKFLQSIRGKTISFIGDSIHSQLFENVLCALSNAGGSIERHPSSTNPNHPHLGFHKATFFNDTTVQAFIAYDINPFPFRKGGKEGSGEGFPDEALTIEHPIFNADIVVANFGAHMKTWEHLEGSLEKLHGTVESAAKKNGKAPRLLWREYSPVHFEGFSKGIDYHKQGKDFFTEQENQRTLGSGSEIQPSQCGGNRDLLMKTDIVQFRLTKASEFMSQKGWGILPVFDFSADQPEMHAEDGKDCRHWCMGNSVLETWKNILFKQLLV